MYILIKYFTAFVTYFYTEKPKRQARQDHILYDKVDKIIFFMTR